jgi:nicotinate-nucleotide adenylyltransferase
MRVALFGGSFNPPHVAHQLVALYVLETEAVDELWFVPCFKHPFEKSLEPFEDRKRMCELAAAPLGGRVRVSAIEQDLGGESLTLRTVKELGGRYPGHRFSLVIGSDLDREKATWYGADELGRVVDFIVVGREGHPGGAPGENAPGVRMPDISSSGIRDSLRAGRDVRGLVPRSVLDYIGQRKLYSFGER